MFLLELLELFNAAGVAAFAERGRQKDADDFADFVFYQKPLPKGFDVTPGFTEEKGFSWTAPQSPGERITK